MFKCWLSQKVTKKRNSTLQYAYEEGTPCDIVIKEPSSIVTPTIEIHGTPNSFGGKAYPDFTLAYIPEFKRYYFVRDIRNLSASQWELDLEEDVLATYKEDILNTKAYIQYAQHDYNNYIPDGRFPNYVYGKEVTSEKELPFIGDSGTVTFGAFTGTPGVVTSYASSMTYYNFQANQMGEISAWLQEVGNLLRENYENPLQLITNGIWMPFITPKSGHRANLVVGGQSSSIGGIILEESNVQESGAFTVPIPYWKGTDDKEEAPYLQKMNTTTMMYLPGVGTVDIEGLVGIVEEWNTDSRNSNIDVDYVLDWMTGEVTYMLSASNLTKVTSLTFKGSLGVPVVMAYSAGDDWGALRAFVNGFTSLATGLVGTAFMDAPMMGMFGLAGAAGAVVNGFQSATQKTIQQNGNTGSFAMLNSLVNKAYIHRTYYPVTDYHGNCANVVGAPVFKCAKVGNYNGYVKCTNCYPEIKCTQLEWEMLDALINGQGTIMSGAKQGGIYIE